MSGPLRPEDLLADGVEQTTFGGVTARRGSVAAFMAKAKLLETLDPGGAEHQVVVEQMRALLPALRPVGGLDDLPACSPAVVALIEGPDSDVHQVVGAVLVRDGRALLVHRSPRRQWYPNVWGPARWPHRSGRRSARRPGS